MKESKPEARKW